MVSLFDDLKQGLQEAIDYEKGTGTARKVTYLIEPVKNYDRKEIRDIRIKAGMTQAKFCEYFDIPRRTLEDWECGKRKPPEYLVRLLVYRLSTEGLIEKGADSNERKDKKTHT